MRPDPATAVFETQRPRLLRLAYRMLGSRAEAEDIVQEAWLRWHRSDREAVAEPAAWLTRIVSRLCLDAMKSARARRETYPGTWLPEPLIEPADDDMRADNITLTLMVALERLSPLERAAFLLHDVFDQPLDTVAATLQRSPAATRQLAARARAHVRIDQPRYEIPRKEGEALLQLAEVGWNRASPAFRRVWVERFFPGAPPSLHDAFDNYCRLSADPETVLRCFRVMHSVDVRTQATQVACPTLVVQGERDELGPLAVLERIAAQNRRVELSVLPGVGHELGRQEGEAIERVVDWLGRILADA